MLWGGSDISVCVVGVSFRDSVLLPSMSIGLVVVLWISMLWFLLDANVGGGQLLQLVASTNISWSGRCVLTDRWSPGSRILLVFMDISLCCVVSGCVVTGGTWSLDNNPVVVAVFVLIVFECCVVVYLASSGDDETRYGVVCVVWLCGWYLASSGDDGTRYCAVCCELSCCVIGKSASLCVLGTVHLLPSREIWLWTKF